MEFDKLLLDILNTQSPSRAEGRMIKFLTDYAESMGYKWELKQNNVYMTKGTSTVYPCFVAHTDTCASFIKQKHFRLYYYENELFGWNTDKNSQTQVGFDDKVGIYIALKMLEYLPYGKAFFPYAEEVGCIGSNLADMTFFNDCSYVIQCDRSGSKGITDYISSVSMMGTEFKTAINDIIIKHGRKYVSGMMTDVYKLKQNGLPVVAMNIECGYYHQHTNYDVVKVSEMNATLEFVKDITKAAGIDYQFLHTHTEKSYKSTYDPYDDQVVCELCDTAKYTTQYYPEYGVNCCWTCFHTEESAHYTVGKII